ncbi:hypothetical protein WL29_22550 [Burkholderia ubonensis]|uniref:Uncharacterized protein n=1 Tax=Burkholderia ubonensis TaxID=101571 RepID=A0A119HFL8_9BURK|nr:hypothetical protein [Burkholderia ubonensis]KWA84147.1 hypothetical protein WL29_22550 [Burkholderia ubonensis]
MQNDQLLDLRTYVDHEVLAAYSKYQAKALLWWSNPKNEKSYMGLDRTTARALDTGFQGARGPVAVYEAWAALQILRVTESPALVKSLSTREGFEAWHRDLTQSLAEYWRAKITEHNTLLQQVEGVEFFPVNPELNIAHRYKLVDLFVRYLRVKAATHPELAQHCREFGHIPLDRRSLAVISAIFSGIAVGQEFRMGNIVSEAMYRTYQRLALAIVELAGGTPLLLDVFALESPVAKKLYKKMPAVPTRKSIKRKQKKEAAKLAA